MALTLRRYQWFAVVCAFPILSSPGISVAQTAEPAVDIVAAAAPSGERLYALDVATNRLFVAAAPPELPAKIAITAMSNLPLPKGVRCVAIGSRWGRLILADVGSGKPVLRELDPQSGRIDDIRTDAPLVKPIALAASPSGEQLVVSDEGQRATVWITAKEGATATPWPAEVSRLTHLEFDGTTVVGLDGLSGRLVALRPPNRTSGQSSGRPDASQFTNLRAFSTMRGIYYLSTGAALLTVAPGGVARQLPCAACPQEATALQTTEGLLYIYDRQAQQITVLPRPVPIGVSIETTFAEGQRALGALYSYLADRGLLAVREYAIDRPFPRAVDALRDIHAILTPPSGASDDVPAALASVFCEYNKRECQDASAYWTQPLAAGTKVTVPDYAIESFVHTETIKLNGRSVAEQLESVSHVDAAASRLEYVQDANTDSFENVLARRNFVIASPARTDLTPGSIITVRDDGAEVIRENVLSACKLELGRSDHAVPVEFPDHVSHVAFNDFLPLGTSVDGAEKRPGATKDDDYVMSFRRMTIQRLEPEATTAPDGSARLMACLQRLARRTPPAAARPLLVLEALRVEGAVYTFYKSRHTVLPKDPLYLAYTAVPISAFVDQPLASALTKIVKPAALKPGGPQDLLGRTTGELALPTIGWSLNAVVPANDLKDPDSPLRAIEHTSTGRVLLLSREVIATKMASRIEPQADESGPLDQAMIDRMKLARSNLLSAIDYRDITRESHMPVRIAIGEMNVDLDHAGMADTQSGATVSAFWTQPEPDKPFVRHEVTTGGGSSPRQRKFREQDHGTHVAGLLAARDSALLPGLLPRADVFFIDMSTVSASNLHKSIVEAVKQQVKVFNLSVSFEKFEESVKNEVRRDFIKIFDKQLFVVAAGDEGKDLMESQLPPIAWMHDVRTHMIGVGMTTPDGKNFEREYEDGHGPDHKVPVSNVGQEYVQMAAPGRGVFSLASDNTYAEATGTSQAAPQVTAAAAMLSQYRADQIKARLIYTASWLDTDNYIWGGRLDIRRAVWNPSRNLYVERSDPDGPPIAAEFDPTMTVTIGTVAESNMVEADGTLAVPPGSIPFGDIMRLTLLPSGRYRVHFIDRTLGNRLRIINEVDVHGAALFLGSPARWDSTQNAFVAFDCADKNLDISEFIFDYVARVPEVCEFATGPCKPVIDF